MLAKVRGSSLPKKRNAWPPRPPVTAPRKNLAASLKTKHAGVLMRKLACASRLKRKFVPKSRVSTRPKKKFAVGLKKKRVGGRKRKPSAWLQSGRDAWPRKKLVDAL